MKKVKIAIAALLLSANVFLFSPVSQAKEVPPDDPGGGGGGAVIKGYRSQWGGLWVCHCPTYQQYDCNCAI